MTDETRPFAVSFARMYDYAVDVIGFTVEPQKGKFARAMVDEVNAAVQARERRAAVKALREAADSEALKDDFGHGEVITKHDVRTALRAEAAAIERGEVAP